MSHTNHPPMMTLQQAFELLRARIPAARLVGDGATPLARVHTDTRTLQAGDLFVALKGERFDANTFLPQAGAAGAASGLADAPPRATRMPLAFIQASNWSALMFLPACCIRKR